MRSLHLSLLYLLCLTLAACGGGGGGGSDARTSTEIDSQSPVVYSGSESPAQINQKNALRVSSNALSMLDWLLTFSDIDYITRPWFLTFENPSQDDGVEDSCTTGNLDVRSQEKSPTSTLLILEFRNCVIEDGKFSGKISYELIAPENDFHRTQKVSIDYLAIERSDEKLEISGEFQHHFDGGSNFTGNMTVRSRQQGRTLKLENVQIRHDSQTALGARLLDSQEGAYDLLFSAETNTFLITGVNDDKVSLSPTSKIENLPPFTGALDGFVVTLHKNTLSGFPISAQLTADTLLDWPLLENTAPAINHKSSLQVDRLAKFTVNPTDFFTDPNDLLDFALNIDGRPNCRIEKDRLAFDVLSLTFECQGKYDLEITADDGAHKITRKVDIQVQPLAAEISQIPTQELVAGQSLSIPLSVSNIESDGPFTYNIAQGPAGLSVSPEGIIQGIPAPLINEENTHFTINVQADNGKKSNISFDINFQSEPSPIDFDPVKSNRLSTTWEKRSNPARYLSAFPAGSSYVIEKIQGNVLSVEYAEANPPSANPVLSMQWKDINGDNDSELILAYRDKIVAIDYATKRVIRTIPLPSDISSQSTIFMDETNSARSPLILIRSANDNYYLVDLESSNYRTLSLTAGVILLGDIDGDAQAEILLSDGAVIELYGNSNWRIGAPVTTVTNALVDIDGDNTQEFVQITNVHESNGNFEIQIAQDRSLTTFQKISIPSPLPEGQPWTPQYGFYNADGVAGDELLLRQEYDDTVYVYRLSNTGYQLRGTWIWDGNLQYASYSLPFTGLQDGLALTTLTQGRAIVNLATGEHQWIDDKRTNIMGGEFASLFKEPDDGYRLFISDFSLSQSLKLNSLGDIESTGSVLFHQYHSAANIAKFDTDGDTIEEFVAVDPISEIIRNSNFGYSRHYYYSLVNALTGEEITRTEVPIELNAPIIATDLTRDGHLDVFTPHYSSTSCIAWYQFGSSTPSQNLNCANARTPVYGAYMRSIDLDGDGDNELISLHQLSFGGFNLQAYTQTGNKMSLLINHTRSDYASDTRAIMGVQDIDADGQLEIIVAERSRLAEFSDVPTDKPRITVIEFNGETRELFSSVPIDMIPDILSPRSHASIIAADFVGYEKLATRYLEIGPNDGALVWSSRHYAGELLKGGFHILDNESDKKTVMAITKAGIIRFH